jgi:hypothetical protein
VDQLRTNKAIGRCVPVASCSVRGWQAQRSWWMWSRRGGNAGHGGLAMQRQPRVSIVLTKLPLWLSTRKWHDWSHSRCSNLHLLAAAAASCFMPLSCCVVCQRAHL